MNHFFNSRMKVLYIGIALSIGFSTLLSTCKSRNVPQESHKCDSLTTWATDRLKIQNLIYAYGVEWDQQNENAYFSLFTEDAQFAVEQIGSPRAVYKEHSEFKPIALDRWRSFKEKGFLRRHHITNIYFKSQSDTTAEIIVYGLLGNIVDNKYSTITSVYYEGTLVKDHDSWKIRHWLDHPDALLDIPVEKSNAQQQ